VLERVGRVGVVREWNAKVRMRGLEEYGSKSEVEREPQGELRCYGSPGINCAFDTIVQMHEAKKDILS
jgi:hypothetical protein